MIFFLFFRERENNIRDAYFKYCDDNQRLDTVVGLLPAVIVRLFE